MRRVVILRQAEAPAKAGPDTELLAFDELRARIVRFDLRSFLLRWREARLLTHRLDALGKPLNTALIVRALAWGRCQLVDERGETLDVGPVLLGSWAVRCLRDLLTKRALLRRTAAALRSREEQSGGDLRGCSPLDLTRSPIYLRTDLLWGLRSGGSVGHIAGVVNNLGACCGPPVFVSTDAIPTVSPTVETHLVPPPLRFRDFSELPALWYVEPFARAAEQCLANRRPSFVYQRYSLGNFSGVTLASRWRVPFVLEYNGSEIWIARNWGRPLKYEALTERIELLNLRAAALVVVVSRAIRDELAGRGIDADKILVNPNGVDPERYSPAVDGNATRARLRLAGTTVVGFIGTFGRWHGAEVLVEAFGALLARQPELRQSTRLLMIGEGNTLPHVRALIERLALQEHCVLTGTVPQEQGPEHLAACDILAAPHVPNPDGTPFFGSPTKLFEYMAMGKGIVASDLDQIGEVLRHDETAWLVHPGDAGALAAGLRTLIDDPALRERLGRAARARAAAHHTWAEHTRRIVAKLQERCDAASA